jgi:orotidine 5'-phosphate decarboxylase subfamily 2
MQKLLTRVQNLNSLLCVGLDPTGDDATVVRRVHEVVAETSEYAAAFKPNLAFFLSRDNGVALLEKTVRRIPAEIPVILDGKFGDISTTAEHYASFAYDIIGADAVTVNPYMGDDTIRPFSRPGKMVFSLAKTSNKPQHGLQDAAMTRGGSISDWAARLAKLMDEELTESTIGLVVGASEPDTVAKLRATCPEQWFLVPGIGAQGGDLSATLRAGLRTDGSGLLINSSRGIWQAKNAGAAARELMEQINQFRTVTSPGHA